MILNMICQEAVALHLYARKADPRCTCPRTVPHACGEIRPQQGAQRAKRTGFLMADASHSFAKPAPPSVAYSRPPFSHTVSLPSARTHTPCQEAGYSQTQQGFTKFGSKEHDLKVISSKSFQVQNLGLGRASGRTHVSTSLAHRDGEDNGALISTDRVLF